MESRDHISETQAQEPSTRQTQRLGRSHIILKRETVGFFIAGENVLQQ